VGAPSGSDAQPNAVRAALSDTPNGQGTSTGARILKPPPVAPVAPWPHLYFAPAILPTRECLSCAIRTAARFWRRGPFPGRCRADTARYQAPPHPGHAKRSDTSVTAVWLFPSPSPRRSHGAGTSRAVSGFPRGYISPNFKVLTSNIPAREHRTPTHG
jgi:hypothetical protein